MPTRVATVVLLWAAACLGPASGPTQADYITLKSGGEIRGEFMPAVKSKSASSQVTVRMFSGATVVVARDDVAALIRRRPIVEEYQTRARAVPDTVTGQWDLAEWCRQNSLAQERTVHLQKVLQLDGEHVLAHRALGHVREQGRWMTRDELLAARGYVKHKGKHVLPQELQAVDRQERTRAAERTWLKQVKLWYGWLESDRAERKSAAVTRLNAIRDPDAIPALVRIFREASEETHRLLFVEILALIEGDKSLGELVVQSLVDESRTVRDAAVTAVRRKGPAKAVPLYVKALKNSLNQVVNRAASALGQLGDERVIPSLIEALLTRHEYRALVRDDGSQFATPETVDLVSILGPSGTSAAFGKSTVKEPDSESGAFGSDREEIEVNVAKDHENPDVLAALVLLTNRNFGYDLPAWRKWHNDRKNGRGKSGP